MKVQGFINVYPAGERGAMGATYGVHKTGNGIFHSKEMADSLALPSRLAVAEFEYEKVSYANVYKGNPWNAFDAAITTSIREYESEEAARLGSYITPAWKPYHIGVVKLNG
jgi:hypothetical protein